ncbi:uncharacterized protein LOC5510643 [Nematostella vectensis]|uniref:uncharacterized protein LOC5510643 n=1 Tax=Nematostella vectensis TaxID=45351 RepID=UPI0020776166|nr:uncharacterized protein LOC5510643 [Nematostella vectensis]
MSQKQQALSRLSMPAIKLFVNQVQHCQQVSDRGSSPLYEWVCCGISGQEGLGLSQVWLQGYIVKLFDDNNDFLLDDGTGVAHITGVNKLVKNVLFKEGMYVMIAGQLKTLSSSVGHPLVRVLKISDLTKSSLAEPHWILEVIDSQIYTTQ